MAHTADSISFWLAGHRNGHRSEAHYDLLGDSGRELGGGLGDDVEATTPHCLPHVGSGQDRLSRAARYCCCGYRARQILSRESRFRRPEVFELAHHRHLGFDRMKPGE